MPPKKSIGLDALKKQLAAEKLKKEKKDEKELNKPQKPWKPKGVVGDNKIKQIKEKQKEEKGRREFFKKLLSDRSSTSNDKLLKDLRNFGEDFKGKLYRREFVKKLTTNLSDDLIYKFAKGYTNGTIDSDKFYDLFLSDPDIKARIELIGAMKGKGKTKRKQKIRSDDSGEDEDDEDDGDSGDEEWDRDGETFLEEKEEGVYIPPPGPKKKTKQIDETGEEIIPTKKSLIKYNEYDGKCVIWYKTTPWLQGKVKDTWILPLDWTDYNTDDFYHAGSTRDIDGETFYKANKKFVNAQCGIYRNQRRQEGTKFYFKNQHGEDVSFEVVFELESGKLIYQDEKVFEKENREYFRMYAPLDKKISELLGRSVAHLSINETESLKKTMRDSLRAILDILRHSVSEFILNISSYDEMETLIKEIVDIKYEENKKESVKILLEKYSLFLSYFDSSLLIYGKTFSERLFMGAYRSEDLSNITLVNVIPEIYLDPRVGGEKKEVVTKYISVVCYQTFFQVSYDFYYSVFPQERKQTVNLVNPPAPRVNLPASGLKGICYNEEDIPENISPYNLYVYKDGERYYCFDLSNLVFDVSVSGTNPYTDRQFPDEVYEDIVRLSRLLKYEEEILPPPEVRKEEKGTDGDGSSLEFLKFIIEDVMSLEEELGVKGENLLSDIQGRKGAEESAEETKEKIEKIENICGHCKKYLKDPGIFSTIVQGKEGSKLMSFCDSGCFEKVNKWPKVRKRSEKLEKKYKDILESEINAGELREYSCHECKLKIKTGSERSLEKEVFCQECFENEITKEVEEVEYVEGKIYRNLEDERKSKLNKILGVEKQGLTEYEKEIIQISLKSEEKEQEKIFKNFAERYIHKKQREKFVEHMKNMKGADRWNFLERIMDKNSKERKKYVRDVLLKRTGITDDDITKIPSKRREKKRREERRSRAKSRREEITKVAPKRREKTEKKITAGEEETIRSPLKSKAGEQEKIFSKFAEEYVAEKHREDFVKYMKHINRLDRLEFMEKIIWKNSPEREEYIGNIFEADEDIRNVEEMTYGDRDDLEDYMDDNENIKKHKDLYDYKTNPTSKGLIYQAFLAKVRETDRDKRNKIYLFFTKVPDVTKKQRSDPSGVRKRVFTGFFKYVDRFDSTERENFIDVLFSREFDINSYVD